MAKHYNLDYERIKVIYSTIITESFSDLCKEDLNDDWVKSDNKLILSVGRISPVKDYLTLIKAFNKIGSQEKFQLLILGNHADMEYFHLLKRERSEEHTSELQSRGHLVCRLLLEKKK